MTTKPTHADFVDGLLMQGITWEKLLTLAKREAEKRGTATLSTLGMLRAHVKFRASQTKRWTVEYVGDSGVRMTPVPQPKPEPKPEKPKAEKPSKPKAAPAPKAEPKAELKRKPTGKMIAPPDERKTGKPVGRKVAKTKEQGRQIVKAA